ncbi:MULTISPECIES: hypothetical protein [Curtobacterium]|jgi:hypothetical protein|uniref:hypothetical protein n=1 Tax=Curtobacterium TaxID=2034 RepID=UPI0024A9819C|nr:MULTISPECIES: hypothetical protein [Curtobacterium]
MKLSNGSRAWVSVLGVLAMVCLAVGFGGVIAAFVQNGGCEVGSFTPDAGVWQPCSALNPALVWGGALAAIGILLMGLTAATASVLYAIAHQRRS